MKGFVLGDVLQWLRFGSFGWRGTEEPWASVSSDSEIAHLWLFSWIQTQ